jgi:hypothetical protein
MPNKIISSQVQRVFKGTGNSFIVRITKIDYDSLDIFDKINELIKQDVLDIVAEGIYTTTFKLFAKYHYIHAEVFVFESHIEVITTIITY